jgi:hypothetical protein
LSSNGLHGVIRFITTAAKTSKLTRNFHKVEKTSLEQTYLQGEEKFLAALPSDKRLSTALRYKWPPTTQPTYRQLVETIQRCTLVSPACEGKVALLAVNISAVRHLLDTQTCVGVIPNLGIRWSRVASFILRPLCPLEIIPATNCTGRFVGPISGEKTRLLPHREQNPYSS